MKTSMELALPRVADWFTCPMTYLTSCEVNDKLRTKAETNIDVLIGTVELSFSAYTDSSTRKHLANEVEWYICLTAEQIPNDTVVFECSYQDLPIATENLEQGWLFTSGDCMTLRIYHSEGYTSVIKATIENNKLNLEEIS